MFDVETNDPQRLRRSIKLGYYGMIGATMLVTFNIFMATVFTPQVHHFLFGTVGIFMFVAFSIRHWKAESKLEVK